MSPRNWDDNWSVGIKELNAEHKELFALLIALEEALEADHERFVIEKLLGHLAAYTRYHCASEEEILAEAGYSGLAEHRSEHRMLQQNVETCIRAHRQGELTLKAVTRLADWYCDHIRNHDKPYTACLIDFWPDRSACEIEAELPVA